jgi:hypothetical protein
MSKMFKGLDQQGRYPEAAHSATEVGTDDDALDSVNSLVLLGLGIVALVFAIAIVVVVLV